MQARCRSLYRRTTATSDVVLSCARRSTRPPDHPPALQRWWSGLSTRGWQAPAWPREYGGAALSIMEQFVYNEELAIARAPRLGGIAIGWAGPTLMLYGNDEQKERWLQRIRDEVLRDQRVVTLVPLVQRVLPRRIETDQKGGEQ